MFSSRPSTDNDIAFDHISVEQGLSQSTILNILQDSQGFMWFATTDGLNRYDGYSFTVFKNDPVDPNSLSENNIWVLYEDSENRLWIGTDGGGLNRFDRENERFSRFRSDPDDPTTLSSDFIRAIHEDHLGNIWIGTADGLNRLEPDSGQITRYLNELGDPDQENLNNYMTTIEQDRSGTLWLGTLGGLLAFDPAEANFRRQPLLSGDEGFSSIASVFEDAAGELWIGTFGDGLFGPDPRFEQFIQYLPNPGDPDSLSNSVVRTIAQDKRGDMWFGTDSGLNRLEANSGRFVHYLHDSSQTQSLSNNAVASLHVDDAGILWVGTLAGGINRFDPFKTKFLRIGPDASNPGRGLSDEVVWAIHESRDGILWIGTANGLNRFDRRSGFFRHYFHDPEDDATLPANEVRAILEDSRGRLWIGTVGGLSEFDRDSGVFSTYRFDPEDPQSLSNPAVIAIYEDRQGSLWVGTAGGGLNEFDPDGGLFSRYLFQEDIGAIDTLDQNLVTSFLEDRNGNFWVGTFSGIVKFDRETGDFEFYSHDLSDPKSLSNDSVLSIYEDMAGRIWVGTEDGFNQFDPATDTFVHYREEDGLPNNVIYGILEDKTGKLWLSSNRGLTRFDPQTVTFHSYDTSDGLQALEFNGGAYHQSPSGEMFFGGIAGLNAFYPETIRDNPYLPPIVITNFQILNESVVPGPDSRLQEPVGQTEEIRLTSRDTVFSFEFAALHYTAPDENQYAYILEGFDEKWHLIGKRRFATYTNLPPGNYTFRVIGSNSDGVWNQEGAAIRITMPYPFWRTGWFIGLFILVVSGAIAGWYQLRTRRIAARTRELEEQVSERTSEIEQRRQIAEGMREILVILNSNRSLEESLHYIVAQAARLTDAEDAIIFRGDPEQPMTIVATNPGGQIQYSPGETILSLTDDWIEQALADKEPLIVPDLEHYWSTQSATGPADLGVHRALLGIPLFVGDEIYGGLIMFYVRERTFSEEDLELGATFADQAALAIANDKLRERSEQTAVASERSRLARDLHDAVTQTLFSASLIAETLPPIWEGDQDEGRLLLQELRQLTRGALAEMRTLLLELRPAALEETELPNLLQQLAEATSGRTGVQVKKSIDSTCELPTNVRVALYRIAQESLNNVVKHARATKVELDLHCYPARGRVDLIVRDNGRGFKPDLVPAARLGLAIIRERSQAIGAELIIDSLPGQGTVVAVHWSSEEKQDTEDIVEHQAQNMRQLGEKG